MRLSKVDACPVSSKAITMTAAPNFLISSAWLKNFSSPSFRLMELTTHLPCEHLSPARSVSQFDESIISGTRAISGSAATRFKNFVMQAGESSMPSSKFMSMMFAPLSTWLRATPSASPNRPSFIILRKAGEPMTFVRSPTNMKGAPLSSMRRASRPERISASGLFTGFLGGRFLHASTTAAMCFGVVPQQPPITLSRPSFPYSARYPAVSSGSWS